MTETQGERSGAPSEPGVQPGVAVQLSSRVRRVTARNAGRMTGPGTNSYLVGAGAQWALIDPGPADDGHRQALLDAAPGAIRYILVTHTHPDHSPGAIPLKAATGALLLGRTTAHQRWQDPTFAPDRELCHADRLALAPGAT